MIDALDIVFHREFQKALDEAAEPLRTQVLTGKFGTFDEYKHAAGQIAGFAQAASIARNVQARILKQDKVRES